MKSKRFRAGISRTRIPDKGSSDVDAISKLICEKTNDDLTGYINSCVGVYCPVSSFFDL